MAQPVNLAELAYLDFLSDEEVETQYEIVKSREYHEGEHQVFLTPRLRQFLSVDERQQFNLNVVRGVIEAITERMSITGFQCDDPKSAEFAQRVWDTCRLDAKQDKVHTGACRDGQYFAIVDWDVITKMPRVTIDHRYTASRVEASKLTRVGNRGSGYTDVTGTGNGCKAHYEEDDPDQVLNFVSKRWSEDFRDTDGHTKTRLRMTIYEPGQVSRLEYQGKQWIPYLGKGEEIWPKTWLDKSDQPLGIPVAHFRNPDLRPEAWDAIPIQDAINKTLLDVLGAGDATAFRIFVALGFIPTTDSKPPEADGSNWSVITPAAIIGTASKGPNEADFKAIDGASIDSILNSLQQLLLYLAIVTRTPVTRFQVTGQVAAEGTLKQQNESLIAKIKLRQTLYGNAWEDVMTIARRLQNAMGSGDVLDETKPFSAQWADAETRNGLAVAEELKIKHDNLGVPYHKIWLEAGYSEAEIEQMTKYREEEMAMQQRVMLTDTVTGITQ